MSTSSSSSAVVPKSRGYRFTAEPRASARAVSRLVVTVVRGNDAAPRSRWLPVTLIVCTVSGLGGCGRSQGELLFMLGLGQGRMAEAKFRLTEAPIMILIDDSSNRLTSPLTTTQLFDQLAQELLEHQAARKIIPQSTLRHLREATPNFEKRGCREIGELGGADQVLWIQVQDFLAAEQIEDIMTAAYFTVTVKVVNVLEEKRRTRVRLWPESTRGHVVTASLDGSRAAAEKTRDALARTLAHRLAAKIAKLFYDHRLGEFEREE